MNKQRDKQLAEMLRADSEKTQEAAEYQEQRLIKADAFNSGFTDLQRNVLGPALAEFAEKLTAGGRDSRQRFEDDEERPPASMLFIGRTEIPFDEKGADHIKFESDGWREKVLVTERVRDARRPKADSSGGEFSLGELTREKVEELIFAFVERVIGH